MKKSILVILLMSVLSVNAQIKLEDVRRDEAQGDNGNNSQVQNNLTAEQRQKNKMNNLADVVVMNAAVVGYASACKFNSENIQRIEDYFIKQYNIKSEPVILSKYREKVAEFKNKGATDDECRIFFKEFSLILKDVSSK